MKTATEDGDSEMMDVDEPVPEAISAANAGKMMTPFEVLSECCNLLFAQGASDVYQMTREALQTLRIEKEKEKVSVEADDMFADTTAIPQDDSDDKQYWQYKWRQKNDSEIYGPFDSAKLKGWAGEGFFEKGAVEVRPCDKKGAPQDTIWHPLEGINFDLYD